jgi:hypothetical protein
MDKVQFYPNERVDLDDMQDATSTNIVSDEARQNKVFVLPEGRLSGAIAATEARLLDGFNAVAITPLSNKQVEIFRGSGFFKFFEDTTLTHAILVGDEGPASQIVDMSGEGDGTYHIYARFVFLPGVFSNRVFWNPSGAPAREFLDNVATRQAASWEATHVASSASPPGNGEYVRIHTVIIAGGSIATVQDNRHFFFEGSASAFDGPYNTEWGDGANDRDTNRDTYGIKDVHQFVQAFRRQMDDVIGASGWYKAAPTSLTTTKQKIDHFVTVDQPGGAAGDYTDLAAAFTALNAADGGTILMREGTYPITVALSASKKINIIAVEHDVILENQLNAATILLTYAAGSDGSLLSGVTISDHATLSSEFAILMSSDRVQVSQCNISGTISIAGQDALFSQCEIKDSLTNTYTAQGIIVSGAAPRVQFDKCDIDGRNNSRPNMISVTSVTLVGQLKGDIEFVDCKLRQSVINQKFFECDTANVDICFRRVSGLLSTPTINRPSFVFSNGNHISFVDGYLAIETTGDDWKAPLLKYDVAGSADKRLDIDGLTIDFDNEVPTFTVSEADVPMYLSGTTINIAGLHCINIRLPNTTEATMTRFINLNPVGEGHIVLDRCRFRAISSAGSGLINMAVLGQANGLTGAGSIHLDQCHFDGQDKTYRNLSDGGSVIWFDGDVSNVSVSSCQFQGGTWYNVLRVDTGMICTGNVFLFTSTVNPDIDRIVYCNAPSGEGIDGYIIYANNHIVTADTTNPTVDLQGPSPAQVQRVQVVGNSVVNLEDSSPPTASIALVEILNLTAYANNVDNGMTATNVTNAVPAIFGNENIVA